MKKRKVIQLKPNAHIPCTRIWCNVCKTVVKTCKANGGNCDLSQCAHIESLSYRFVAFIPGTKQRIVRSLGKDFNEMQKQAAILREQLESGTIEQADTKQEEQKSSAPEKAPPQANTQAKPELITHLFGKYLASLKGEGIASHLKVVRSKSHYNDVKNSFRHFLLALKNAGYPAASFKLTDINDEVVGIFHDHILAKGYSNNSYNRFFSHFTTFASWCEGEEYGSVKRFFERVPRKAVTPRPEIVTAEEFNKTLSVISYENGWQYGIGKRKEKRNHFQDYLVSSFTFAALTGRRLEEIITCRLRDVHTDENGSPLYIEFTDHKVSRILHVAPGEERKVFTPVTQELAAFIKAQGFGQRHPDEFILAPEVQHRRVDSMRQALTRSFSHFFKVAFPDSTKEASFKTLRKTYLTNLAIHMGKDVTLVSGHGGTQVLRHYIDDRQLAIAESLNGFSVFGKEDELKTQRKAKNKQQSLER